MQQFFENLLAGFGVTDAIDILQVLLTLEEERGITIPDEELATFKVVQDVVDYLEKQL